MPEPRTPLPRVAMVSGGAGGIGRQVVRQLLADGFLVSVCDRTADVLSALSGEIGKSDTMVTFFGNVADRATAVAWFECTRDAFGIPDALVNVAGLWRSVPFLEIQADQAGEMLDANLMTAFWCCQAVARAMLDHGSGSIVNFASTAGEYGSISPASDYAAAKGGVIALTKSLARELSPHGIRVNAISPGPIDTSSLIAGASAAADDVARRTLVGRLGTPADIAGAVAYLVSEASTFVTGQVLGVNGGSRL